MNSEEKKKKILIVDDEEGVVDSLTAFLEEQSYEVSSAPSGEKGLERVQAYSPDLILLDILLPGEDGFAILKKLKRSVQIPVILLTGYPEKLEAIVRSGEAFSFFTKPFHLPALLAGVRRALERKTS